MAANVEDLIWSVMEYEDEAIKFMLISSESQRRVATGGGIGPCRFIPTSVDFI